ncbi:MAG: helix-turn-helix domain-containing protein [Prevotella sp.]|nr:helix-turn-helix domain-containing protein [Prevotella sp.]
MNVVNVIHKYGFTTKEVSKALGKHEKTLDVMLAKSRETNSMTVATLRSIADVLGCSIGEFFEDEPVTKNGVVIPTAEPQHGALVLDIEGAIARSGLQKRELAKKIGITDVALSVMLRTGNPSYQRLRQIADALGISFFDLFKYEEQ